MIVAMRYRTRVQSRGRLRSRRPWIADNDRTRSPPERIEKHLAVATQPPASARCLDS